MTTMTALPASNLPRTWGGEGFIAAAQGASPGVGGPGTARPADGTDRNAGRDTARPCVSRPATNDARR